MKIFFITNAMGKGGAERVICNLTSYLSNKNEITIISVNNTYIAYKLDEKIKYYTLDDEYTDIYSNNNKNKKNIYFLYKKISTFLHRVKKLNKYKRDLEPDIIVAFTPIPSFITLISNVIKKVPTIVSIRNDPKKEFKNIKNYILMKWLYPKCDGFVFQTNEAKEYFDKKIQKKSEIIPNPINPIFIEKSYQKDRNKEIVSVGRLEKQKNQKILIEAFANIASKYNEYKLIIYGEGKLREELQELIKKLNLSNKVFLPGNVENIKEKIYKAEMFVLSSEYEGMPNALMEAMALGVPVISTDCPCGGPKFLIKNNINGILVENKNKDELINAIEKIILNPNESKILGINASKISETLNPDIINRRWENYIEKILTQDIEENKIKNEK